MGNSLSRVGVLLAVGVALAGSACTQKIQIASFGLSALEKRANDASDLPPQPAVRSCGEPGPAPDGRVFEEGEAGHRKFGANLIGGPVNSVISDDTHTIRTVPKTFHGMNDGFFYDGYYNRPDTNLALSQLNYFTGIPVSGVLMDWYLALDPAANGRNFASYQLPVNPGLPENVFDASKKSGARQVLWGLNETTNNGNDNSPAGYAAIAKYLKDHGVDVMGFQEGNEPECAGCGTNISKAQYLQGYENAVAGVRTVYPSIPVFGPATFNYGPGGWNDGDWVADFLKAEGNIHGKGIAAGVSFHYYNKSPTLSVAFAQDVGQATADVRNLAEANDSRDLDLIISEFGANNAGNPVAASGAFMATAMNLAAGVREVALQGLSGYQYFGVHGIRNPYASGGGGWGLLTNDNDGSVNLASPAYYAFRMTTLMGQRLHPTLQGIAGNGTLVTYGTSRADGSQQIMAINKSGGVLKMGFGFKGFDPSGGPVYIHTLVGASLSAETAVYNGKSMPAPSSLPAPSVDCVRTGTFAYELAPFSITVLDFVGPSLK